jgi:hypothetical protein
VRDLDELMASLSLPRSEVAAAVLRLANRVPGGLRAADMSSGSLSASTDSGSWEAGGSGRCNPVLRPLSCPICSCTCPLVGGGLLSVGAGLLLDAPPPPIMAPRPKTFPVPLPPL